MMYAYAVGDYEQVLRWSKQLITECEMHHIHDEIELVVYAYQGKAQVYWGEQAHKSLAVAVERSEQLGHRAYQAWTKIALGELRLAQGAWQEALALGEAALAMTDWPDGAAYRMAAQTLLALICRRRQDGRGAAVYGEEVYAGLAMKRSGKPSCTMSRNIACCLRRLDQQRFIVETRILPGRLANGHITTEAYCRTNLLHLL